MKLTTVDVNSWETLASDTMCGFWMAWFQMLELNNYGDRWPGAMLE